MNTYVKENALIKRVDAPQVQPAKKSLGKRPVMHLALGVLSVAVLMIFQI